MQQNNMFRNMLKITSKLNIKYVNNIRILSAKKDGIICH